MGEGRSQAARAHDAAAGMPRPDEATYDALARASRSRARSAAAARPNPGRTETFRRLSRVEYQNAIRDILALDVDVSALLPKDDASHGFDNVSNGELSPTLLERYLAAAQKVSRAAGRRAAAVAGQPRRRAAVGSDAGGSPRRASARHTRRHGRPIHVPAHAVYEIQIRCRAIATRTSRGSPSRSRSSSRSTAAWRRRSRSNRIAISRAPTTPTRPSTSISSSHRCRRRSARRRRRRSREDVRARGDRAAAEPRALQHGPASARADRALLGVDHRPVRARRRNDTPSRRPSVRVNRRTPRTGGCLREDRVDGRAPRVPARSPTPISRRRCGSTRRRAPRAASTPASRWRSAPCSPAPSSCSASSAIRRTSRRRRRIA